MINMQVWYRTTIRTVHGHQNYISKFFKLNYVHLKSIIKGYGLIWFF